MPLTSVKFVPYEMKSINIKIFSYKEKNPVGILSNPFFEKDQVFESLTQLILIIDTLQDSICFPQKTMEGRSFCKSALKADNDIKPPSPVISEGKCLASLKISVMFRQNASWQGSVQWLEQAVESEFRSVLELITLIDSVLIGELS